MECSKSPSDPRPESLRINPDTVEVGEEIPSAEAEARAILLERSPHLFA